MRGTARAAAAAAATLALAAGCGTVHYQGAAGNGQDPAGHARGRTTAASTPGAPVFTRTQAERLARELLSRAPLPAGAQRRTGPPVQALGQPPSVAASSPSVALHELWTVAQPMTVVDTFLTSHVPAGMTLAGSGLTGQAAGIPEHPKLPAMPWRGVGRTTEQFVTYQLSRLPAGVSDATLSMAVAPTGPKTSELRADVQVTWYPPRSAAEYVPAGMHAVTITASVFASPRPAVIMRTFTSPAVVGRLAAMLNGAHASSLGVVPCPMQQAGYRLAFARAPGTAPYLVADETGCLVLMITVLNHAQPALQAPDGLSTLLASLMHVRTVPGTRLIPPPCAKPARGVWSGAGGGAGNGAGSGVAMPAAKPLGPKSACTAVGPAAP